MYGKIGLQCVFSMSTPKAGIESFFQRLKRKPSSTSSSDSSSPDKSVARPTPKKLCPSADTGSVFDQSIVEVEEEETSEEMASTAACTLETINNKLDGLATKQDLQSLTDMLTARLAKLEETVTGLEMEKEAMKEEVENVKKENKQLKQRLQGLERRTEKNANDQEQYSRRWNLRVYGLKEGPGEDCVDKCLHLFNGKVKVATKPEDIQVAHRVGSTEPREEGMETNGTGSWQKPRTRAVIVQFASRRVRDQVILNRKVLAGCGVSIAEDLTNKNFKLLKRAQDHSATNTAWPSNGKIIALLKNGKKVKVDLDTDLDRFFTTHMNG